MFTAIQSSGSGLGIDIVQDPPAHAGPVDFICTLDGLAAAGTSSRDAKVHLVVDKPGYYRVTRAEYHPIKVKRNDCFVRVTKHPSHKKKTKKTVTSDDRKLEPENTELPPPKPTRKPKKKATKR